MTFSPRIVEAKLALNMIHPEDFPMLAIDALVADLDGPTIRQVSGLINPSGYTMDLLSERFMAEAGLATISRDMAFARLAQELARKVISSGSDPLGFTRELRQLYIAAEYPSNLLDIGSLEEDVFVSEYCGQSLSENREMVRKRLAELANLPDVP